MSSPNSRKSAVRPAFSSCWLNSAPVPLTFTFFQNSSRMAGIFAIASVRDSLLRAIPQLFHMTIPSSRMNSVTVLFPLTARSFFVVPFTSAIDFMHSGWSAFTLPGFASFR